MLHLQSRKLPKQANACQLSGMLNKPFQADFSWRFAPYLLIPKPTSCLFPVLLLPMSAFTVSTWSFLFKCLGPVHCGSISLCDVNGYPNL